MSFGKNDAVVGIPRDFDKGKLVEVSLLDNEKWNLKMIGWPNIASRHRYGLGVRIAIIDSGYSPEPGLPLPEKVSSFGFTNTKDENGHGTHVFGICSAIAPTATYHIYKVLGGDGQGTYSNIANAIKAAIISKMDIINLSLGGNQVEKSVEDALLEASKRGITIVCASGNTGKNKVLFPALMDDVIAVGAVNRFKGLAAFSTTGEEIDVVAPGVDIVSNYPNGEMRSSSGTSMAAPHVTGIIALIIDHHQEHKGEKPTPERIKKILYNNCIDLGFIGWDEKHGNGLVMVQFHKNKKDLLAKPPWYIKIAYKGGLVIAKWIIQRKLKEQ